MGNRSSRRRQAGAEPTVLRRKHSKRNSIDPGTTGGTATHKHVSCPPLGGAIPYQFGDDRPVNVRLYRSFRNPNKCGTLQESSPEIRIYRRCNTGPRARTSVSLPRQFGRSKSARETPLCELAAPPKAATLAPNGIPTGRGPPVAAPVLATLVEAVPRRRPVNASEYPSTDDIRRKLSAFEERFYVCLVDRYRRLPDSVQLSSLPIAFRKHQIMEAVSLLDYFTDSDVPMDLLSPDVSDVYTPIIPTSLLHGIHHVRRDKMADRRLWTSLARDIVTCIALETAIELSRIYEYQIVVLRDDVAVQVLAEHAAECVIAYVIGEKTSLDRNSAILGVVRARSDPHAEERMLPVIVGSNQMQWSLQDIFVKPGLRKDANLLSDEHVGSGDSTAQWEFYTTKFHKPVTYGYRAEVLEWDYLRRMYRRSLEDEYFYTNQTSQLDENGDIHHRYRPFKRLLGVDCMKAYCAGASSKTPCISLVQFLKQPADDTSGRREIQPVYRPLTSRTENTRFDNVILDNVDLTRLQLDSSRATGVKARNANLLLAEFRDTKIEAANLSGSDISYSNVSKAIVADDGGNSGYELTAAPPCGIARHVSLNEQVFRGRVSSKDETDGNSRKRVSDAEGNIVYVDQVVEKLQQKLEGQKQRRERRSKLSSNSTSSAGSRETGSSSSPLNGVVSNNNKIHIEEQQQVRRTHSAAERRLRSQHSSQSQPDCRVAARPTGKPPPRPGGVIYTSYVEPHVQRSAAMPIHAASDERMRSLSSTYINGPNGDAPRSHMTKSASHHGHMMGKAPSRNPSMEAYGLSLYPGRRTLSQAEVEFLRRSQVFRLISKIHIDNLPDDLPPMAASFTGRDSDVDAVLGLYSSGPLLTITGSLGVGKSALAVAVGHTARTRQHRTTRYVDTRGCATADAVIARLVASFGLCFKSHEMTGFYGWLSSHEQRFLLVFDNIEVGESETGHVSELIDNLLANVADIHVLCTGRTQFYGGSETSAAQVYQLGDLSEAHSGTLLRRLLPDLHDEGISELAEACGHVAFSLVAASSGLTAPSVDVGQLYEALMCEQARDSMETLDAVLDVISDERARATKVLGCVKSIIDHIPGETSALLFQLSFFSSWFDAESAFHVVVNADASNSEELAETLTVLAEAGLLVTSSSRFYVADFVRLAAKAAHGDEDGYDIQTRYCRYFVGRINALSEQYNTKRCYEALHEFRRDADDIMNAVAIILARGCVLEDCAEFAEVEHAMLLYQTLPEALYLQLYTDLEVASAAIGDASCRCRTLCCLAYNHIQRSQFAAAKKAMQTAHDVSDYLNDIDELSQAFVFHCLGRVYFTDEATNDQGMALTKRARDLYARLLGMRSARALLANEDYGVMATKRRWFASAHHCYNLSSLIERGLLDGHISLIASYDSRRSIWDSMMLFARATDAGRRAVTIARRHYGEHPLTATMTANLCDAVMKRGSLTEAVEIAVDALALRVKVLGEHRDTAASYKVLAYLMLRSGQYDESVRFGESALEIYEKTGSADKTRVEVKNIIAQARYRLEYKSSVYVELESRDASKGKVVTEEMDSSFRSSITTEV